MTRLITYIVLTLLACSTAMARSVSEVFVDEASPVFGKIDKTTRMDMVDYYAAGQKKVVNDQMDGDTYIESMIDDYMKVVISSAATVEMRLVESNKGTIIVVSTTYLLPAADSRIDFYDETWHPLDSRRYVVPPVLDDLLVGVDKKRRSEIESIVDFTLVSASLADVGTIVFTPSFDKYLPVEDYAAIKPYVRTSVVYRWNGKRYTPSK